jgi:hypothetical protein
MKFTALALLVALTAGASIEERLLALESHTAALEADKAALKADTVALKADKAALKAETAALKADTVALKADSVALKNSRAQVSEGLIGEIRMFGLDSCPVGWTETKNMQGRIPVFRPTGGLPLQVLGNPLKVNETNHVGPHTHPTTVNDPGHDHKLPIYTNAVPGKAGYSDQYYPYKDSTQLSSMSAKTGITVTTSENKGDSFPFVYVVVCTPVAL